MAKKKPVVQPGKLWPNMPISGSPVVIAVVGGTGEYRSGKTLFGLQIAPGVHPEGHPFAGKPRTRVYDVEKSTSTYQGTGAEIINVIEEVQKTCVNPNDKSVRIPTALEIYLWLLADIAKIQPGQFDVIMIDPITDFDAGLASYIRHNPGKFDLTANQISQGGGLLWGAVKQHWKTVLATLASRCQTFYFTAHLRDEFMGAVPTGRREPKGKDTLLELASLYLWFDRKADVKGEVPEKPRAVVMKERLSDTVFDPETGDVKIVPLLPPKIPVATPFTIREYISNPPDYEKLKPEEKYVEPAISEDDRLALKAMISSNEAAAAASSAAAIEGQQKIVEMQQRIAASAPQTTDRSHQLQTAKDDKREESAQSALTQSTPEEPAATETAPTQAAPTQAETPEPAKEVKSDKPKAASEPGIVKLEDLKILKTLLNNIQWPENGQTTDEHIKDLLIRSGVPQENGQVQAIKMPADLCQKLIELTKKKLVKQGVDPEELLGK